METKHNYRIWILSFLICAFSQKVFSNHDILLECQMRLKQHPTFNSLGNTFILDHEIKSKTAIHLRFQHLYHLTPVLNSYITFHFVTGQQNLLIDDNLLPGLKIPPSPWVENQFIWKDGEKYFYSYQTLAPGKLSQYDSISIQSTDGSHNKKFSALLFNHDPDTTLTLPVFNPNPVETAKKKYGYPLVDNKDRPSDIINAQYKFVQVLMRLKGERYQPFVPHILFTEISDPVDNAHLVSLKSLPLDRSHNNFEMTNVAFHLNAYMEYLTVLGFEQLMDTMHIDVHGLSGADQSAFNRFRYPVTIEFGQGGVDDAEDGQVVVHEFIHGLANRAWPLSFVGKERISIEEGTADYLSISYSNLITNGESEDVFSWDGHNEFWSGYKMHTQKKYDKNESNATIIRELWSSSINCISKQIGSKMTDELVLEQLFYLKPLATVPEMAKNLLMIDTLLNQGQSYSAIKQCFIEKGILETEAGDIEFFDFLPNQVKLINNNIAEAPDEKLIIIFNKEVSFEYSIIDEFGRVIFSKSATCQSLSIDKTQFTPGFYVLKIIPKNGSFGLRKALQFKVIF